MNEDFLIKEFECLESTNSKALGEKPWVVIVAASQKKGRGRFERVWLSPKGGLYFSVNVPINKRPFIYTFAMSVAVQRSLPGGCDIHWPNDIYYGNRKICGILSESVSGATTKLVVGVGINVNNTDINQKQPSAISIKEITGKKTDTIVLLKNILSAFKLIAGKDDQAIIKEYSTLCRTLNRRIAAKTINKTIRGIARKIDSEGMLLIEENTGKLAPVYEGDVTISEQSFL